MKSSLRQHLAQRCPENELRQWFDPLRLQAEEDDKRLVVTFPHSFFADWFRATVKDHFEEVVSQFLEPGYTVAYEIGHSNGSQVSATAGPAASKMDFPYGREFTFETFISNKKNYFPVASAKSVAKNQDASYNPFCICGDSGSGKTHLMRAMANEVSKTCEKQRIFLGSMEDLAALVTKIRRDGAMLPRQAMQQYQFLFVDDFHRLREDFTMQEELIQIFDMFHESRRQMVFCCPEKITACDYLLPSLKSRMEWGLVVLLARQDVDIRARYIQRMCDAKKIRLTKEQMLTLAQRFESFRYLQGIMLKLLAFKELVHGDIQDEDFARILEYTENRPEGRLSAEEIQTRVAEHFNITLRDLVGDRRQQNVVFARQVAMFLCRELTGVSYPGLGRLFGGKDHSTVMYAVRKITKLQKENKDIRTMLVQLKKKCS